MAEREALRVLVNQSINSDWNNIAGFAWNQYEARGESRGVVVIDQDSAQQQGQAVAPLRYFTADQVPDVDYRDALLSHLATYDPSDQIVVLVILQGEHFCMVLGSHFCMVLGSSSSRLPPPDAAKVSPAVN